MAQARAILQRSSKMLLTSSKVKLHLFVTFFDMLTVLMNL